MEKLDQTPQEELQTLNLNTGDVSSETQKDPLTIVGHLASRAVELNERVKQRTYAVDKFGNVARIDSSDHRVMIDRDPDHTQ